MNTVELGRYRHYKSSGGRLRGGGRDVPKNAVIGSSLYFQQEGR